MRRARVMPTPIARCPGCAQVWLVPGLRPGEKCACKACGRLITVSGRQPPFRLSAARSLPSAATETLGDRKGRR